MTTKKRASDPDGIDPEVLAAIVAAASQVLGNIRTGEAPGPINLQAFWCEIVKVRLSDSGASDPADHMAESAIKVADLIVEAFKQKADALARDTAELPYFDTMGPADSSEPE